MSWDLEKKKITLDQQAGKESSQILLEGDVIVPDNKPDIEQILRCSGIVQLQEAKGNEDRVNFSGELLLSILYQGKKSIKPINPIIKVLTKLLLFKLSLFFFSSFPFSILSPLKLYYKL